MHDPESAADAAEARRLGGLRRRREHAVAGAYEFEGLDSVEGLRRVLEIVILDTLQLENSVTRNRTLVYAVAVAGRLLVDGELEARLERFEAAQAARLVRSAMDEGADVSEVTDAS